MKAYGNAVVPQVAYVVGCRLFEHLTEGADAILASAPPPEGV